MSRVRALLGSALFLLLAPGAVAGLAPELIRRASLPSSALAAAPVRALGLALAAAGLGALLASFLRFAWQGRGTPAPIAPTETLVVAGLYRHVRNPMYLAVIALVMGQGLVFARLETLAYGAALWAIFHAFVLGYEEPTLRRSFPAAYARYEANVPRWRPRLRPWRPS